MNRNPAAFLCLGLGLAACAAAPAQVFTLSKEQLMKYTEKWQGDRFPDGRPKVDDKLLQKMDGVSAEEIWGVLPGEGYRNQYEGDFRILHPEKKLIGRAVTVQFMPARPDMKGPNDADAKAKGVINTGQSARARYAAGRRRSGSRHLRQD